MDAIRLLTDDHKRGKALFREYEELSDSAHKRRQQVVERAFRELEIHTKIQVELFYPAFRAKADDEGQDMVRESCEEHHVVDVLMGEMTHLEPDSPQYAAKFTVLMENIEHHADEEEKEMFPKAKELLKDDPQTLGAEMEQRKEQLMAALR